MLSDPPTEGVSSSLPGIVGLYVDTMEGLMSPLGDAAAPESELKRAEDGSEPDSGDNGDKASGLYAAAAVPSNPRPTGSSPGGGVGVRGGAGIGMPDAMVVEGCGGTGGGVCQYYRNYSTDQSRNLGSFAVLTMLMAGSFPDDAGQRELSVGGRFHRSGASPSRLLGRSSAKAPDDARRHDAHRQAFLSPTDGSARTGARAWRTGRPLCQTAAPATTVSAMVTDTPGLLLRARPLALS